MKLLVSVRSAEEALAARAGGADIIDAKDPGAGVLGAVTLDVMRTIRLAVGDARPVTAALGDAEDEEALERAAGAFAGAGAALVKVGLAGITSATRAASLIAAAVRGARAGLASSGVIAVAYADADGPGRMTLDALVDLAAHAGAEGVLVDTAQKHGPGLRELLPSAALAAWARRARDAGLLVAMAGRLAARDLAWVRDAGADVAGVRGAACDAGRLGRVSERKVREMSLLCRNHPVDEPRRGDPGDVRALSRRV